MRYQSHLLFCSKIFQHPLLRVEVIHQVSRRDTPMPAVDSKHLRMEMLHAEETPVPTQHPKEEGDTKLPRNLIMSKYGTEYNVPSTRYRVHGARYACERSQGCLSHGPRDRGTEEFNYFLYEN